jgi:hypothetical protein
MSGSVRGLVWEILQPEQLMVSYYDGETGADRWDTVAQLLTELRSQRHTRFLVYQQQQPPLSVLTHLTDAVRGAHWRVAMVSPSAAMRFVASSFSLIVKDVRFFAPEALDAALDHLNCSGAERQRVDACLRRLREPT